MSAESQRILDGIRRIVQALRVSSRQAERATGLSGAQLFVLQRLSEGDGISLGELAARTHTHQSSVSVVVSRLVAAGYVARQRSVMDKRQLMLELTAAGREALTDSPSLVQDKLIAALRELSPQRRQALAEGLETWVKTAGIAEGAAQLFFEEPPSSGRAKRKKTLHDPS